MKRSDRQKMSASKLATLSATVLLVSLGLCGANAFFVVKNVALVGSGQAGPSSWRGDVLNVTGVLELIGVAFGIGGLLTALWRGRG